MRAANGSITAVWLFATEAACCCWNSEGWGEVDFEVGCEELKAENAE